MSFRKELDSLKKYIEHFDPEQFSSSTNFRKVASEEEHLLRAKKIKEKLNRKHQLSNTFRKSLDELTQMDSSVLITQEEIDNLLAKD